MTRICDLPPELVGKIFTKIPITSLGSVRSTCKLWKALPKEWVLGEAATRQQCVGFMKNESKVCSLRFDVQGIRKGEDELVDRVSVKQVLKVTPDWEILIYQGCVSAKGNTYFHATERDGLKIEGILFCFDFTRESFGPRLPFPCDEDEVPCCYDEVTVTLSCVREEQLAVLYRMNYREKLEIWVTIMIEPNALSWSKFLIVDLSQHITRDARFNEGVGAFFIDEGVGAFFIDVEENVAVFFVLRGFIPTKTAEYPTAFISGRDGYLKTVSFRGTPSIEEPGKRIFYPPLEYSSSYLPSLVQIQPTTRKTKKKDD
ncbi:PREDICTED: putative F-box protein At4g17200 [Camelina sativa]|uniref:F-box protein At4g17200 n=1 Tax=Camelina sativa TaxID=90675 RepID=A0ABM1R969_CAMSA|nr:PREDICTED: putative F-box protein At4g17200 [Camelina sativa]